MEKPKISIVAVNWWARDFATLLVGTAEMLAKNRADIEFLILDNSADINDDLGVASLEKNLKVINPGKNLGHGKGMDFAIREYAQGDYIFALDIDAHILLKDWDAKLLGMVKDYKLIAAEGGQLKPVRPCAMFFERQFFIDNDMSFVAQNYDGAKFDVGVHFYFKTLSLGHKVGLFKYAKTQYKDVMGCEYTINGDRFVYHNFYGTRWYNAAGEVKSEKIDKVYYKDFQVAKDKLFEQV